MSYLKYFYTVAILFLAFGLSNQTSATPFFVENECNTTTVTGSVIIVEIGYGTSRAGFETDETPKEFASTVREESTHFKSDFETLMTEVYAQLNVSNPSQHPVHIIEPDFYNSWRRVDMADVIMGTHNAPWMYVIMASLNLTYEHSKETSSAVILISEHNTTHLMPVECGMERMLAGFEADGWNPANSIEIADSIFWVIPECDYYNQGDLHETIIIAGTNINNTTYPNLKEDVEARIHPQRFRNSYVTNVLPFTDTERKFLVWRSGKKIATDGILPDWDLAFTQSHYQSNGSGYIRQWIY